MRILKSSMLCAVCKTPKTTNFIINPELNPSKDAPKLYLPRVQKVTLDGCYALKEVEKCLKSIQDTGMAANFTCFSQVNEEEKNSRKFPFPF